MKVKNSCCVIATEDKVLVIVPPETLRVNDQIVYQGGQEVFVGTINSFPGSGESVFLTDGTDVRNDQIIGRLLQELSESDVEILFN